VTLYFFYFLSFVAVFFALLVVFSKNPVHSVLYLILCFFAIGLHYFLLAAEFLMVVHIIVYAGAIMVLFLHVLMLLNLNNDVEPHKEIVLKFAAGVCALLLLSLLIASLKGVELMAPGHPATADMGTVKQLGHILFTDYLLPFEITSVLLLASMIGAVMLGKPEQNQETQ